MQNHNHDTKITTTQFFRKICTSHFTWNGYVWEGVGDRTELQNINLHSYGHQRFFPARQGCSTGGQGAHLSAGCCFLYSIISPTILIPKLTDFLSSPSYIIVHSPTQYLSKTDHRNVSLPPSLEWHVWSPSRGNRCHAVHMSLSSGASVCNCTVGF